MGIKPELHFAKIKWAVVTYFQQGGIKLNYFIVVEQE